MNHTLHTNNTSIGMIDIDLRPLGSVELEAIVRKMIICISHEIEKISSSKYAIMNASRDVKRRLYTFINFAYSVAQQESVRIGKQNEFTCCVDIKTRIKHDLALLDVENAHLLSQTSK